MQRRVMTEILLSELRGVPEMHLRQVPPRPDAQGSGALPEFAVFAEPDNERVIQAANVVATGPGYGHAATTFCIPQEDLGRCVLKFRLPIENSLGMRLYQVKNKTLEVGHVVRAFAPRLTTHPPITSTSIFVRKKQSSASSGRHTTGSFSLNEVFSTIGTPVKSRNALISP